MCVTKTDRLILREFRDADAPFVVALLNDPEWLRFIGDRGVRTLEQAHAYIANVRDSYSKLGFGLYVIEQRKDGAAIGLCGLLKRDMLTDVDLGFALLSDYRGQGYAFEAANSVLEHARAILLLKRVVAITLPDNLGSIGLLQKLGLQFVGTVALTPGGPERSQYSCDL